MSKDLEKFTSSSLRGMKKGIYEHSMCSLLMKGINTNDPLIKTSSICEAALLSKNKDKLDPETVTICHDVCTSFRNTFTTRTSGYEYVNVAWIFSISEESYNRYIVHWHKISLNYYPLKTGYRNAKYPAVNRLVDVSPFRQIEHYNEIAEYEDRLTEKIADDLKKYTKDFRFFVATSALTLRSYNIMQGEFTNWALANLSDIRRELLKEISPQVWKDFTGQEKQEKEVIEKDE